jgi:hypothetical protein
MKKEKKKIFKLRRVALFLGIGLSIGSALLSQLYEANLKSQISVMQRDLINSDQVINEIWEQNKQLETARQNLIIAATAHNKDVNIEQTIKSIIAGVTSIEEDKFKNLSSLLKQKKFDSFNKSIFEIRGNLIENINLIYTKRIVVEDKIQQVGRDLERIMRLALLLQIVALVLVLSKDA